jgi:hypothetical protein
MIEKLNELVAELIQETLIRNLLAIDPDLSTSRLVRDIRAVPVGDSVEVFMPNYAIYVEKGRKPGVKAPPVSVIVAWIKRKKIPLRGGRINAVAYAIARSIGRWGIKAKPFIERSADELFESEPFAIALSDFLDQQLLELLNI